MYMKNIIDLKDLNIIFKEFNFCFKLPKKIEKIYFSNFDSEYSIIIKTANSYLSIFLSSKNTNNLISFLEYSINNFNINKIYTNCSFVINTNIFSLLKKKYYFIFKYKIKYIKSEILDLYMKSFNDSIKYAKKFINSFNYNYYLIINKKIVSMANIIIKKIVIKDKLFDFPFIVAVATIKDFQKKGFMKKIINNIFKDFKNKYILTGLFPENELYYKSLNLIKLCNIPNYFIPNYELKETSDPNFLLKLYLDKVKSYDIYTYRDINYYIKYLKYLKIDNIKTYLIYDNDIILGYISYKESYVEELFFLDNKFYVSYDSIHLLIKTFDNSLDLNKLNAFNLDKY